LSPVFKGKIGVTPLLAAPGDTNPSDATAQKAGKRDECDMLCSSRVNPSNQSTKQSVTKPTVASNHEAPVGLEKARLARNTTTVLGTILTIKQDGKIIEIAFLVT